VDYISVGVGQKTLGFETTEHLSEPDGELETDKLWPPQGATSLLRQICSASSGSSACRLLGRLWLCAWPDASPAKPQLQFVHHGACAVPQPSSLTFMCRGVSHSQCGCLAGGCRQWRAGAEPRDRAAGAVNGLCAPAVPGTTQVG